MNESSQFDWRFLQPKASDVSLIQSPLCRAVIQFELSQLMFIVSILILSMSRKLNFLLLFFDISHFSVVILSQ